MEKKMFAHRVKMNLCMGFTMSFILSLVGNLTSGHFTVPAWLQSAIVSFVISVVIGFLVPIKVLSEKACHLCKVELRSMKGNLVGAAVSNLVYTPILTILMVVMGLRTAAKHAPAGVVPPVMKVLPRSMIVSLVVGYIVILIVHPLFIRLLIKKPQE